MNKFFCLLLAIMLISFSLFPSAFAEATDTIDLQSMTIDELYELRSAINKMLVEKTFKKESAIVQQGRYIIGEDIPAGVYQLRHATIFESLVTVYDSDGKIRESYSVQGAVEIGKLPLSEGEIIEILYAPVIFEPYIGAGMEWF